MCVLVLYAAAAPFVIVAHTTNMWIAVAITFAAVQSHIMLNEVRTDLHCTETTLELLLPTALLTDDRTTCPLFHKAGFQGHIAIGISMLVLLKASRLLKLSEAV